MHRSLFVLPFVFVLLACGGGATTSSTTPVSTSDARGQRPRSTARIITHADAESFVARYDLRGGEAITVGIAMDMGLAMQIGPQAIPRVRMPRMNYAIRFEPVTRDAAGNFQIAFETTSIELEGAGDLPPAAIDEIRRSLEPLRGFRGRYTITARGELLAFEADLPDDLPDAVRSQLEQFQNSLEDMVLVWPLEPIGVGSVVEVEKPIRLNGIVTRQRTRYRVLSIEGTRLEIETVVQTSAEPQDMPSPPTAPDTRIELRSLVGRGSGRAAIDLRSLGSTSRAHAEVTLEARIIPPTGDAVDMATTIDLDLEVH